ncbi:Detected protein of unknown function [Hibiscus syriacus]|uniref:Uncharacterized protein n=1 Tax=Hibiscus syriacus TaxID=106335 RepID=A0A6A3BF69_HIBSY|nr:Detected protein of unknown function [Hibiscus syriacus]
MGTKTRSQHSSERLKGDQIFQGLVKMLKTQQQQLETLAKERKILEDRFKMQYERWVSDVRLYEDHISQMESELQSEEMVRVLEAAKADMLVGLKQRKAFLCEMKLDFLNWLITEESEDESTDFRDISQRDLIETKKGMLGGKRSGSKSVTLETLEDNVRRIKLQYENLVSEKSSQATALMAENNKQSELEKANKRIETLISDMEELRSSNAEKDEIIESLKAELSQKEADASRFQEASKISWDVELSRKSKTASCTPGSRSTKRKKDDAIPLSETPKLFTPTFKVPRLKTSSPKIG